MFVLLLCLFFILCLFFKFSTKSCINFASENKLIGMILDQMIAADKAITVALNFDGGSVADAFFYGVSNSISWVPLALLFLYLIYKETKGDWWRFATIIIGLVITITLCDRISSGIIKPLVMRPRPSHDFEVCTLLHYVDGYRGGMYGFVSSHAANAFGAIVYCCSMVRKRKFTIFAFCFALIVSYSRIYLGVHYFGDVVCGALLGMAIGFAMSLCVKHLRKPQLKIHIVKRGIAASALLIICISANAEDSVSVVKTDAAKTDTMTYRVNYKHESLYKMLYTGVPLIFGGMIVKGEDTHFRNLRNDYMPYFHRTLDNYMQFAPAAVLVGLKAMGVKSRSSWNRMLTSDAFSTAIMAGVVNTLKTTTHVMRPDGSNNHSFPSGHTATAFMTATMLTKEYGQKSPWIGIGAYSVASATGLMRMANNKHWLSDVMTGAGIGIISTELGYWLGDLIFKEKGINENDHKENFDRWHNPSFVSLYLAMNIPMSKYDIDESKEFRTSSGCTAGIEGAYFFNPYIGVGGRFTASNTNIIVNNNKAEDNTFDAVSVLGGGYFSYPFTSRLAVGSKLLVGYIHYPELKLSNKTISSRGGITFGSGLSTTYRVSKNYSLRLFLDYNLMPSHSRGSNEWMNTLNLGTSFVVTF